MSSDDIIPTMSSADLIPTMSSEPEQPKHNYGLILCILVLFFIVCLVTLLWIFQPNDPNLHVDDATLTQFTILPTNSTLYYNLVVNMRFRNDNRLLRIKYDKVEANAMYQGHRFAMSEIEGFHLGRKKENGHVGIEFKGEHLMDLDSFQKTKYDLEKKDGVYEIELKLSLEITYKAMWVNKDKNNLRCRFKVPLSSEEGSLSSTKFERTKCF